MSCGQMTASVPAQRQMKQSLCERRTSLLRSILGSQGLEQLQLEVSIVDDGAEELALGLEDVFDPSLDRSLHVVFKDLYRLGLRCADAVQAVHSLLVHARCPELVEKHARTGCCHVQSHSSNLQHADDDSVRTWRRPLPDNRLAVMLRDRTVEFPDRDGGCRLIQPLTELLLNVAELSEHHELPRLGDLKCILHSLVELCRVVLAGERDRCTTDLLQAQELGESVLDLRRVHLAHNRNLQLLLDPVV